MQFDFEFRILLELLTMTSFFHYFVVLITFRIIYLDILQQLIPSSIIPSGHSANAQEFYSQHRKPNPENKFYKNYRATPWCVTGRDEPEFHFWPWNQFVPYLKRASRMENDLPNFRYRINASEITTELRDAGRSPGGLFKIVHIQIEAEERMQELLEQRWIPLKLEGFLMQAHHNPQGLGAPTGEFFKATTGNETSPDNGPNGERMNVTSEINCGDCEFGKYVHIIPCRRRVQMESLHPTMVAFHHLSLNLDEDNPFAEMPLKQSEFHVNFRWYSPYCTETRRLEFLILGVRSFAKHEYDTVKVGPFEITIRGHSSQSDVHPSPVFEHFTSNATCHENPSTDITPAVENRFMDFEMSPSYDQCVRLSKSDMKDPKYVCPKPPQPKCNTKIIHDNPEEAGNQWPPCEPCPYPSTTPPSRHRTTEVPKSVIKRSLHGAIMIIANFCFQPIVIMIARYHKETFNTWQYKGMKLWYLMHIIGGLFSTIMSYFGYFQSSYAEHKFAHVIIGQFFIAALLVCYLSSWCRHKKKVTNLIVEMIHWTSGYLVIILAVCCFITAPNIGFIASLLVYLMLAFHIFFSILLEINICMLDKMIGMKPKRRHLPTIEQRFEDIAVPGARYRKILLYISASITIFLCILVLFFH